MPQGWDGGTKGCVSVARGCPQVPIPTAHSHPPSVVAASPGPGPSTCRAQGGKAAALSENCWSWDFSAKPGTPAQTARRGAGLPFFIILIFMVNKKEIFSGSSPGQAEGRRRKNKHFLAVVVPFWRQ